MTRAGVRARAQSTLQLSRRAEAGPTPESGAFYGSVPQCIGLRIRSAITEP